MSKIEVENCENWKGRKKEIRDGKKANGEKTNKTKETKKEIAYT